MKEKYTKNTEYFLFKKKFFQKVENFELVQIEEDCTTPLFFTMTPRESNN